MAGRKHNSGNRPGWTKSKGPSAGCWSFDGGWQVRHCGHPTALWPYTAHGPKGEFMIAPSRKAFSCLAYAQDAVEALVNGLMTPFPQEGYLIAWAGPDGNGDWPSHYPCSRLFREPD